MTDGNTRFLGTSTTNSMQIDLEKLRAPGLRGTLSILAIRKNETRNSDERRDDQTVRSFTVSALLATSAAAPGDANGNFTANDGTSYVLIEPSKEFLQVELAGYTFRVYKNSAGELSMISMNLMAQNNMEAKFIFIDLIGSFIDYISYIKNTPIRISKIRIKDNKNDAQYIDIISPFRPSFLIDAEIEVFNELRPIYALFREARNSDSAYYQLLCYYKIMEGINTLKSKQIKRAKKFGFKLTALADIVPNHRDLSHEIRPYIGKSIQHFKDNFLTRRYRDAAAHFTLRENTVLHVSSPQELLSFSEAAFACELCVRQLIKNYENLAKEAQRFTAALGQPLKSSFV
ncbi:hypothetical protein SAMN06265338_11112 [Rhodoblastus acidophilus]|uniref:Uncharacterized protein n=1 Tax=Rhodoblastus acidophilus TaxID=1074 RepID=A0A212S2X9_RHOAC|nr:methylamine utilization protein MauJ [Rhodoblastus acidophilus]SNB79348.1 hypothetical protein SAMN06265338_11112 [Rhodoblastus acidophilus]